MDDNPELASYLQEVQAEVDADKAARAAVVWAEIKSMARDYAIAAEIRTNMHVADHAMMHIIESVLKLDMNDSAEALDRAWRLVTEIVGPIMELEQIDADEGTVRGDGPSTEEPARGGERATPVGERASNNGAGASVRRLGDCPPGEGSGG